MRDIRVVVAVYLAVCAMLVPLEAAEKPPSILIITVDALRADHLGCYGYPKTHRPTLID
ncbi:MAG: hypothetical protein MUP13_14095 [Thermoanaerobaculales bacterium]|nr:hypothetical protein [Thermoanaerobaculales bacterium]